MIRIKGKEYLGVVLLDKDPKLQGRYKVHIPELMPKISKDKGIWCKNHVQKNRITSSDSGFYGSYIPLQPNTNVIVKFYTNDYNSGFIERIVSDDEENTKMQPETYTKTQDRDDVYIIMSTPKKKNIIYIAEETEDVPANEMVYAFNERRSSMVMNEDHVKFETDDEFDVDAEKDLILKSKATLVTDGNHIILRSDLPVDVYSPKLKHNGHNACVGCGGGVSVSTTEPQDPHAYQVWINP